MGSHVIFLNFSTVMEGEDTYICVTQRVCVIAADLAGSCFNLEAEIKTFTEQRDNRHNEGPY